VVAELATDLYGTYVVQIIIQANNPNHISAFVQQFSGHFFELSIHKFASNVIEKYIRSSSEEQREKIFDEIIGSNENLEAERIFSMAFGQI
jgi:hypothetical protein